MDTHTTSQAVKADALKPGDAGTVVLTVLEVSNDKHGMPCYEQVYGHVTIVDHPDAEDSSSWVMEQMVNEAPGLTGKTFVVIRRQWENIPVPITGQPDRVVMNHTINTTAYKINPVIQRV